MAIVFVGIDLAKNVFAVHGVNPAGKPERVRPSVPRAKLHEMIAALPPCTIGMEACSGGSSLGQVVSGAGPHGEAHGAEVRRAVPPDRQARQGYIEARTATINRVRGLLSEVGIVLPLKAETVRREAMAQLEDLPGWVNTVIGDLLSEVHRLDERIAEYDRHVALMARHNSQAQQLLRLRGVGETTATALITMIGNGRDFHNGRQLSAWIGLVPGHYSSGGKTRLGRITKSGDAYLRSLLVMGARAVLNAAKGKTDSISRWATALAERVGYWKAVVAIAAKNARMAWAVLVKGEAFAMPA